jgi:hypothetical protein
MPGDAPDPVLAEARRGLLDALEVGGSLEADPTCRVFAWTLQICTV